MKKILSFIFLVMIFLGLMPKITLPIQAVESTSDSDISNLRFDDHVDMTNRNVEIIDSGTPTSFQVGYGIGENTIHDTAVVTLVGNTLVATGIGTAVVKVDQKIYNITVTAAPISLLMIIGQSNAEGMVGNANQSIACENGQVYSTYAKADGLTGDAGLTVSNAGNYVPSALTGKYSIVNVNGTDAKLSGHPVNSLTEAGNGKYGMDSGLAYEWVKQTGEKVWIVNAAHGASSISSWQPGQSNFEEAKALLSACQEVLMKEIKAGHFTFSRMGYYWCQGCADETKSAEWYVDKYLTMHQGLKNEFGFDGDLCPNTPKNTMEFGGIVLVMAGHENVDGYRKGAYEDTSNSFFASFKELEMRGPRVAQIWMANNPELEDIHIVCTLAQDWVEMPDGTNGVKKYFQSYYNNGIVDYPTQKKQSASWYSPTTPAAVKNSIHYYQVGYNEVGREAARNTLYILGLVEKPNVETTVTFVDWTGYQTIDSIKTSSTGSSNTLVVPIVHPCYESKKVTYTVNNQLVYKFYDLIDTGVTGGTLSASVGDKTVQVTERPYYSYRFELTQNGLMTSISDGDFQNNTLSRPLGSSKVYALEEPIILRHDKAWRVEFNSIATSRFMALTTAKSTSQGMFYFFKSAKGSHVISIGEYKDQKYQNYGVLQSKINIDWLQPHTYCFQNVINEDGTNTIHIYVDSIWVGTATTLIIDGVVKSTNNMYLSGKDFSFTHIGCAGFELNEGQMTFLEVWEDYHTHSYENGICLICGIEMPDPVIIKQPKNVEQKIGQNFSITVSADGKDLTYQWYYKDAQMKEFEISSNITSTYCYIMTSYRHNRQVYCVITDKYGNRVTTDIATISLPPTELKILNQPKDVCATLGDEFSIEPEVQGDGLRYQWYYKENHMDSFKVSANNSSSYAYTMEGYRNGRQVYCVITDQYGNCVTTDIATISLPPTELKILNQPKDVCATLGDEFSIEPEVQGDGLRYQWYYKENHMDSFKVSANNSSSYAYTMEGYRNGRQVYCVITDKYGNQVITEMVTINLKEK